MSLPVDHSKGHAPARAGDHRRWNATLYHNVCGHQIVQNYRGYTCAGSCRVEWKYDVINNFSDDAMATRFHIRAEPDKAEYAIVWVTSEGKRHTAIVPTSEAHKYERFKL